MKLKFAAAFILLTPLAALAENTAPPEPPAQPGVRDPGVNDRQHNQRQRVTRGVASGELTHEEAKGLREDRRAIRQKEREYKADGSMTKDERKDLHQDLRTSSKDIHTQKHDDEKRPRAAK